MTKPTDTAQQTPAATPTKRRVRGPNRPKPDALITVTPESCMKQAAIIKVLMDYATKMIGSDAAGMELQALNGGGEWTTITSTETIRFATKGSK